MSKDQVIAKGKYAHEQPDSLIGVKQYIFVRGEDGRKRLLLRFNNNRQEKCSKFAFILSRLDAKGNVLGEERLESSGREYGEKEIFSFDRRIEVEEKCTDFVVKMVYARYGNYVFNVENNEVSVAYDDKLPINSSKRGAVKAKPRKISGRSFDMPWIFAIISLIVLAVAFAVTGILLRDFMDTEKDFSLAGVHYKFVDKEKKEVVVVGCSDNYREIELSSVIDEDYKVVGIEKGAFKGNKNLKKLTVNGINIDNEAFRGCTRLVSVNINNVSYVGKRAFYNCDSLEGVIINEGKENPNVVISSQAFGGCKELKTVEINQTVLYGEENDFFKDSNNIESLKLRNFAYTVKGAESKYVTRLNDLFGVDDRKTSPAKLRTLEIANIDSIPNDFAYGFSKLESVKITKSEITKIGANAFRDCKALNTIEAKMRLEELGSYALSSTAITSIDLKDIKIIGTGAFKDCAKLQSVTGLGKSKTDNIPGSAFAGCSSLKSFEITPNIKYIHRNAFASSGLESFSVPQGVNVSNGILEDCKKIKELKLYELGTAGFVGYYFGASSADESSDELASYIPVSLKTVILENGTEINAHAFKGCSGVERIDLPEGVVSFGEYAFAGCTSLKTLDMPKTTLKRIGRYAFYETALESLELPTSLEYIGYGALNGCTGLKHLTIPFLGEEPNMSDGRIGHAFADSVPSSLTSISLVPNTYMVALPAYAFSGCEGAVTINVPSSIAVVGEGAFKNCKKLAYVDLSRVTSIGESAFEGCASLTSVQLCSALTSIGSYAFKGAGLTYIDVPVNLQVMGVNVFEDCKNMTAISVPFLGSTYESLGDARVYNLFSGSMEKGVPDSLISISVTRPFPEGKIPSYAFYNCKNATSINIEGQHTGIGEGAFQGCAALPYFDFSGVKTIGISAFRGSGIQSLELDEGVYEIRAYAFMDCAKLNSVTLPEGVEFIESGAFRGTGITLISLPTTVRYIEEYAFAGSKLTEITLPSNLIELGYGVLMGCNSLTRVEFPITYDFTIGGYTAAEYLFDGEMPQSLKSITLNASSTRYLPEYVFAYAENVEEIIITANIRTVGDGTFEGCRQLRYVCLPSSVTSISSSAFNGCYRLYEITTELYCDAPCAIEFTSERAPTVTTDAGYTYALYNGEWYLVNYPKGGEIKLEGGFTYKGKAINEYSVPSYLFYEDYTIESVNVPSSVKSIGSYAFADCSSLKSVNFESNDKLSRIDEYAFAYCYALEKVILPSGVSSIGDSAFYECNNLTEVTFPRELTEIGAYAFYNCGRLNGVKLYDKVTHIGDYAFYQCYELYDVYNASSLNIVAGDRSYGEVALYAARVHKDMNEALSTKVYIAGKGTFMHSGTYWLLIKGDNIVSVNLGEFKYQDTKVTSYRIKEGAFANCYSLEELIIGNEVKAIQRNAFMGCNSLKSVSFKGNTSILALEPYTFAECGALESAILPSSVKEIGEFAFYNCNSLDYIEMPVDLESIGDGAFQNCASLISITLNSKVQSIGENAFLGCEMLLEVFDLSSYIYVSAGTYDNGMVGYYADGVFTSASGGLDRHEQNGIKLIKTSRGWYLYDFADMGEEVLTIPNMGDKLIILSQSLKGGTFKAVILPTNLKTIEDGAFSQCHSLVSFYYQGTYDQWRGVNDEGGYGYFKTVYYYSKCVHYGSHNIWTYDEGGKATTSPCEEMSRVIKEPDCYNTGIMEYSCACKGCDFTRQETMDKTEHSFTDNACTICKSTKTLIDETALKEYTEKGIVSLDRFIYDGEKGYFVSQNKDHGSTSYLTITAQEDMTVSFTVKASSEAFDYVTVSVNGLSRGRVSGKSSSEFNEVLEAGDTIVISYEKDSDTSRNEDCGFILDLTFILKQN